MSPGGNQGDTNPEFDLFMAGCVWEDEPYGLRLEVRCRRRIRRVTFSVNAQDGLRMRHVRRTVREGGKVVQVWHVESDDDPGRPYPYTHPFCSTCGFARIEVCVEFPDGSRQRFHTPDIAALDEPRRGAGGGERAEEENVRNIYRALVRPHDNQAAKWMFSEKTVSRGSAAPTEDLLTDWAYEAFARTLDVASEALDRIHDALDDASDAFPNVVTTRDPSAQGIHDTWENRLVRALVASIEERERQVAMTVTEMLADTTRSVNLIDVLLDQAEGLRQRRQSLPAAVVFRERQARERDLLTQALDISDRVAGLCEYLDDETSGMGKVSQVPFEEPPQTGLFAEDATYRRLLSVFDLWAPVLSEPLVRRELTLHAMRPDHIFEYAAEHRLLSALHEGGFRETRRIGTRSSATATPSRTTMWPTWARGARRTPSTSWAP